MDPTVEAEQVCTNPLRNRRIDFGVCHRQIFVDAVSHFDLPHLSDHISVLYQLDFGMVSDCFRAPRPSPLKSPDADAVHASFLQSWDQPAFDALLQAASTDDAWAMLSDVAENALGDAESEDAPETTRSASWAPLLRRTTAPRASVHGHESATLRLVRKFSARIHQLSVQPHAQPLRKAVQRSLSELRRHFANLPFVDLDSPR